MRNVFTEEGTVSAGLWPARSPHSLRFLHPSSVKRESEQEQPAKFGKGERFRKPGDKQFSCRT
jgi:hypothetical protein